MRVGHVIESIRLRDGGPSSALLALSASLIHNGCQCNIACRHHEQTEAVACGTRIVLLPRRFLYTGSALKKFAAGVDILHLHGLWDSLPVAAGRYAAQHGIPYIMSLHGMLLTKSMEHHPLRKHFFLALSRRELLSGAAALHFTTQAELEQATPLLPIRPERVVIPLTIESDLLDNPPDANRWRQHFPELPDSWPRLLFLSRIHQVKNLPSLIAAIPALTAEFPGVHLLVAGGGNPGYVRKMRALAESSSAAKRIIFVGAVTGEAKAALICSATIMTIPSFHENFGMAVAEGLACSIPVLVTPGLGIGAEILACGAGFSCGEDAESISVSLARALRNPEKLRATGEIGRRWALKTLSPQTVSCRFKELYSHVILNRHT